MVDEFLECGVQRKPCAVLIKGRDYAVEESQPAQHTIRARWNRLILDVLREFLQFCPSLVDSCAKDARTTGNAVV
ncbi:hypothetical protein QEV59_00015 [Trueperella pyogenes]|uniref:hypothetical protein n=1 Tax=Trueperella pyogenes TaxID=1661 RepID=UPI003132AE0F